MKKIVLFFTGLLLNLPLHASPNPNQNGYLISGFLACLFIVIQGEICIKLWPQIAQKKIYITVIAINLIPFTIHLSYMLIASGMMLDNFLALGGGYLQALFLFLVYGFMNSLVTYPVAYFIIGKEMAIKLTLALFFFNIGNPVFMFFLMVMGLFCPWFS